MGKQISLKKPAIAVILAILIPSLILAISEANSTIESRSYGLATVVYKEVGLFGSPSIEIKINGVNGREPIRIDAFYPTLRGVERLDLDRGRGAVFKASPQDVGPGMAALLQDAGWSSRASLGLLLFITTYDSNKTHVIGKTMSVTVPLKPSHLARYKTVVEVDYKPDITTAIEKQHTTTTGGEQPPSEIPDQCYFDPELPIYYCLRWELSQIVYETPGYADPLPMQITLVDDVDSANHIDEILHDINIYLKKSSGSELTFTTALTIPIDSGRVSLTEIHVPGPGFTIRLDHSDPNMKELLNLYCNFDNMHNDDIDNSGCLIDGVPEPGLGGSFDWMGYVATGIQGKTIVAEYEYVRQQCDPWFCGSPVTIGSSYMVWVVPATTWNDKLVPWVLVDDTAYIPDTLLDHLVDYNLYYNYSKTQLNSIYSSTIHVDVSDVFMNFDVTTKFGVSIPVGAIVVFLAPELAPLAPVLSAISVGIAYNTYTIVDYHLYTAQTIQYDVPRYSTVSMYNSTIMYYINEFGNYYDVVLFAVDTD